MSQTSDLTKLHEANEACQKGRISEIKPLLDQWTSQLPPDPNRVFYANELIQPELETAAQLGLTPLVGYLLDCGAEITPGVMIVAHASESTDVFQCFLDHGWDINGRPIMTSLHRAVADQNLKLVEWHLAHGANPDLHTGPGGDPLTRAASLCNIPILQTLVKHGATLKDTDALIGATASVDVSPKAIETMKYLLDLGVDVNHVEKGMNPDYVTMFEGTALHRVIDTEDVERLRLLLMSGADPSIKGLKGMSPIEVAKGCKRHEMVSLLEEHGKASLCHQ